MRSRPWMQKTRSTASGIRFWSWWCSIVRAWCCRFSLDLFCEEMHTATGEVSPSGKGSEPSCNGHLTGKRTKLSWDNGHPPECAKYKTEENCRSCGEVCVCVFPHPHAEAPSKKSKKYQKFEKHDNSYCKQQSEMGCASQNVELPEQTVGLTNENRSILKETGKRSPRAHLKLKYTRPRTDFSNFGNSWDHLGQLTSSKSRRSNVWEQRSKQHVVARRWCKKSSLAKSQGAVQNSRNVPGERIYFLRAEVRMGSSINRNRQSWRESSLLILVHLCIWWARSRLPTTVITANGSIDTTEEATVHVNDLEMFVAVQLVEDTPVVPSLGKSCGENVCSHERQGGQTPNLVKNAQLHSVGAVTSCPPSVLVDEGKYS